MLELSEREIVEQILANDAAQVEEIAQRPPPPPPPPEPPQLPAMRIAQPFHRAVEAWLVAQIVTPRRIARWMTWCVRAPWRAGSFLWTITGPVLPEAWYKTRCETCESCARMYRRVRLTGDVDSHCGTCGCPPWYFSRLAVKNRFKRWRCPLFKHAGTYPQERQRAALEELGYDADKILVSGGYGGASERSGQAAAQAKRPCGG